MPFGLLLDLWECHKQYNGQATPAREHYIDDIIPEGDLNRINAVHLVLSPFLS